MKKNRKKGFTLAEILGVIVIIGILLILVGPMIITKIGNKKELTQNVGYDLVYEAAQLYINENKSEYPNGKIYCISIQELINDGKLVQPVINAATGESIEDKTIKVKIHLSGLIEYDIATSEQCASESNQPFIEIEINTNLTHEKTAQITYPPVGNDIYPLPGSNYEYKLPDDDDWKIYDISKGQTVITEAITKNGKVEARMKYGEKTIYANEEVTLDKYTIIFNGNGNSGGSTSSVECTYNKECQLAHNEFIKTGYIFDKWNTKADGTGTDYTEEQQVNNLAVTLGNPVTLYAMWRPITYTIIFNGNSNTGGSTANKICNRDSNCILTNNGFTKTNYKFLGWATSAGGAKVYNNKASVNNLAVAGGSIDLYAVWRDNTNIYVSSSGNDSTGYGTIAAPYATVGKAYSEAASTANIWLMSDITQTATTTMNSNKNITLKSCTKSGTTCSYKTPYTLKRGNSNTSNMIYHTAGTLTLTNIIVNGNNVNTAYRMIDSTKTLNINSGTTLLNGKAGAVKSSGTINMNAGTITGNYDADAGGGINVASGGTLNLKGGSLTNNSSAGSGGAIYVKGTLNMTAGTVGSSGNGNTSDTFGGGIMCQGKCTISGGTISYNKSKGHGGGGIWVGGDSTAFTFSGGTVSYNEATSNTTDTGFGGGIGGRARVISGGTISNNKAKYGGGLECNIDNCKLSNVVISNNNARTEGGGAYITSTGKLIIDAKAVVKKNTSNKNGGIHKTENGKYTRRAGYVCKNNSPTNDYDTNNKSNDYCK